MSYSSGRESRGRRHKEHLRRVARFIGRHERMNRPPADDAAGVLEVAVGVLVFGVGEAEGADHVDGGVWERERGCRSAASRSSGRAARARCTTRSRLGDHRLGDVDAEVVAAREPRDHLHRQPAGPASEIEEGVRRPQPFRQEKTQLDAADQVEVPAADGLVSQQLGGGLPGDLVGARGRTPTSAARPRTPTGAATGERARAACDGAPRRLDGATDGWSHRPRASTPGLEPFRPSSPILPVAIRCSVVRLILADGAASTRPNASSPP